MKASKAQKAGRRNSRRSTCDQERASTHLSPDISRSSSDMLTELKSGRSMSRKREGEDEQVEVLGNEKTGEEASSFYMNTKDRP